MGEAVAGVVVGALVGATVGDLVGAKVGGLWYAQFLHFLELWLLETVVYVVGLVYTASTMSPTLVH